MCGRFSLAKDFREVLSRFGCSPLALDWNPRYNIAPHQKALVVRVVNSKREINKMSWGLIPSWTDEKKRTPHPINARAETLDEKPFFRGLVKRQRCLIPADGFFEWKSTEGKKIPYRIIDKGRDIFSFAGLWDLWKNQQGEEIYSFTIITTNANKAVAHLHHRMPVMLSSEEEDIWLNSNFQDFNKVESVLHPPPASCNEVYEVSSVVNSWKNDLPECIERKQ